ncbi:MAG: HAD family hydrolase [Lachnospiraceae bacterium]|nr:HAD family hydrolase [Lachnospiraceae bacterium]
MFDSIIFDVDGTIWDSTPVAANAWNRALEEQGFSERVTADRLKGLFGLPMDAIIKDIIPWADDATRKDFAPHCFAYEHEYLARESGFVYQGIHELFRKASARVPLFIVSNCQAGYIELMLAKTGLGDTVTDHLCPGDTGLFKADNILKIVGKHNLTAPLYVGDTQMDLDACRAAGVPFCYATYGFGTADHPDHIIDSPLDLMKLLN